MKQSISLIFGVLVGLLLMAAMSAAAVQAAPPTPGHDGPPREYWLLLNPALPAEASRLPLLHALGHLRAAGDVARFDRVPQAGALLVMAWPDATDKLRVLPGVVGLSSGPPTPAPSGEIGILATGAISGVVTAEGSGAPLSSIYVCASRGFSGDDRCAISSNGVYTIAGLVAGSYAVGFRDFGETYAGEYYDDKPSWYTSDPVAVTAGGITRNINAALSVAGHITGVVAAEGSDAPLSGIGVCAEGSDGWQCTATGGDGEYDIGGLAADDYRVEFIDYNGIYAGEYYNNKPSWGTPDPVAVTAGGTTPDINAALSVAGRISGTVTAAGSGAPLSGIGVCAGRSSWQQCATTGSDGGYDVGGLAAGNYRVEFNDYSGTYAREYYDDKPNRDTADPVAVTAGNTTSSINAALSVPGRITGVVTAEGSGTPLSNIWVCANNSNEWQCATTDYDGVYAIGGLTTSDYRVEFTDYSETYINEYYDDKPSWDTADPVAVTVGITTSSINAALSMAGHITGAISAEGSGAPLSGIDVCTDRDDGQWCATTGGDGRYDIGGLAAGSYRVEFIDYSQAYAGEYYDDKPGWDTADLVAVTAGGTTPSINAALSMTGHITGTVTAEDGSAFLSGIRVCAGSDDGRPWSCASTGADGGYDIAGLSTGNYRLEFTDYNGIYAGEYYDDKPSQDTADPVAVTMGIATPGINAALSTGGHITGTVTTEGSGAPLSGIRVCADRGDWEQCATTGGDGRYDVGGLATGNYKLHFTGYNQAYVSEYYNDKPGWSTADPVAVIVGITTPNVDAALSVAGHITGIVTAEDSGAPLSYVVVCVTEPPWSCVITNDDGRYDIGRLATGNYRIEFSDLDRIYLGEYYDDKPSRDTADPITVTMGITTTGIDAVLSTGGHITGVVTAEGSGAPLSGIRVCADNDNGQQCATTGGNGRYDIGRLATGNYRVEFIVLGGVYAGEYYNDKPAWETADPVAVTAPGSVPNINASLRRRLAGGSLYLPIIVRH